MDFYIGQTFEGVYPPEAAVWCNGNNAHIEEITKEGERQRKFTIAANPKPQTTIADLTEFLYQEKCKVAYGGVTVVKGSTEYLFETNQDSITMCNSMALAMANQPDDFTVSWKVWQDGNPVMLTISKAEFNAIFAFGMVMINTAFGVEGDLNETAQKLTDEQLADDDYVMAFKKTAVIRFATVNNIFNIG
jgi:hypothetical protein